MVESRPPTSVCQQDGCLLLSPAAPECHSSALLFLQHMYYLDWSYFFFFHAELEFIKKQIKNMQNTWEKKGKYYLNWGLKNPDVEFLLFFFCFPRSLSLFLKGTCTFNCLGNPVYCCHRCTWRWICLIFLFYIRSKSWSVVVFNLSVGLWHVDSWMRLNGACVKSCHQILFGFSFFLFYHRCTSFVIKFKKKKKSSPADERDRKSVV